MRTLHEDAVSGVAITFKELTLAEIRAWLKEAESGSLDAVDATLFDEFSPRDLTVLTDLDADALDALTPRELREVYAKAKELNADFFAMRSRMVALGRRALGEL